jgi:lysine-specific demethylase 3
LTPDSSDQKSGPSSNTKNRYDHLDDVTMDEAANHSLPTAIANAVTMTTKKFQEIWRDKNPLLVQNYMDGSTVSWDPKYFSEQYGDQEIEVIDCQDYSKHTSTAKEFFDSYESEEKLAAYCEKLGTSKVTKIKVRPYYIHTRYIRY